MQDIYFSPSIIDSATQKTDIDVDRRRNDDRVPANKFLRENKIFTYDRASRKILKREAFYEDMRIMEQRGRVNQDWRMAKAANWILAEPLKVLRPREIPDIKPVLKKILWNGESPNDPPKLIMRLELDWGRHDPWRIVPNLPKNKKGDAWYLDIINALDEHRKQFEISRKKLRKMEEKKKKVTLKPGPVRRLQSCRRNDTPLINKLSLRRFKPGCLDNPWEMKGEVVNGKKGTHVWDENLRRWIFLFSQDQVAEEVRAILCKKVFFMH
jgi:hypothetical protein